MYFWSLICFVVANVAKRYFTSGKVIFGDGIEADVESTIWLPGTEVDTTGAEERCITLYGRAACVGVFNRARDDGEVRRKYVADINVRKISSTGVLEVEKPFDCVAWLSRNRFAPSSHTADGNLLGKGISWLCFWNNFNVNFYN